MSKSKSKATRRSEYSDLAREHSTNVPSIYGLGIEAIETYVSLNGEQVKVDTILSLSRRMGLTESANRQVYYEFELLEKEGVLPTAMVVGNKRYYPTTFLEPIASAIASDLYARTAGRANSGKASRVIELLMSKPELMDAIVELLEEAPAR